MNNIINISQFDLATSTLNMTVNGVDATVSRDSAGFSGIFEETIQKLIDQVPLSGEMSEAELSGNHFPIDMPFVADSLPLVPVKLPPSTAFTESTIDNDGDVEAININIDSLLLTENKSALLNTSDLVIADGDQAQAGNSGVVNSFIANNATVAALNTLPDSTPVIPLSSITQLAQAVGPITVQEQGTTQLRDVHLRSSINTKPVAITTQQSLDSSLNLIAVEKRMTDGKMKLTPQEKLTTLEKVQLEKVQIDEVSLAKTVHPKVEKDALQVQPLQSSNPATKANIEVSQNTHADPVQKQLLKAESSTLQGETSSLNDMLLKEKLSLSTHNLMDNVKQESLKSRSVTASLENIKLNNQDISESNKLEATVSSSMVAPNKTEQHVSAVTQFNVLSPQLRTLLQAKSKMTPVDNVSAVISNNSSAGLKSNAVFETSMMKSLDALSLMTETSGLNADKLQTISNTLNQQQLSVAQQISQVNSMLQASTNLVDKTIDSTLGIPSLGIPGSTLNTLSNINLTSIHQAEITEAFGRTGWSQSMGKQVLSMVNQNIGSAEIRLNPAHLGPIEVLIELTEDQVNVSLNSRHAIVREAMEQALPRLREMLDENGFNLADADISKHSFAEQREQNSEKNNHTNAMSDTNIDQLLPAEITDSVLQHDTQPTGTVDYFV